MVKRGTEKEKKKKKLQQNGWFLGLISVCSPLPDNAYIHFSIILYAAYHTSDFWNLSAFFSINKYNCALSQIDYIILWPENYLGQDSLL